MLQQVQSYRHPEADSKSLQEGLKIRAMLEFLRSYKATISLCVLLSAAAALAYIATAEIQYTANASLLIDSRKGQLSRVPGDTGSFAMDIAEIETQVQVVKSHKVALAVVDRLNLTQVPDFTDGSEDILSYARRKLRNGLDSVLKAVTSAPEDPDAADVTAMDDRTRAALILRNNLGVGRQGASYVLNVSYSAASPALSAEIANAIMEAYIADRLESKRETAQRAVAWMQERIEDLRDQHNRAARAAQAFRAQNGIIETGRGLLNEQQLAEFNTRLVAARGLRADARAKLDRIEAMLASGQVEGELTDAIASEAISRLRTQFFEVTKRESEAITRYGIQHTVTQQAREEAQQLKAEISAELQRISASYKSEFEIAKRREEEIAAGLNETIRQGNDMDEARVRLRELESIAQAYKSLYESFLKQSAETAQQESSPVVDARIITDAIAPTAPSHPKRGIVLTLALLSGACLGVAVASVRSNFDRAVRRPEDIAALGFHCLGVAPEFSGSNAGWQAQLRGLAPRWLEPHLPPVPRLAAATSPEFHDALRRIRAEIQFRKATKSGARPGLCLGITSASTGDGKTTVAYGLAEVFAQIGAKTLLLRLDGGEAANDRSGPRAARGRVAVMTARDLSTLAPQVPPASAANSVELIGSDAMQGILDQLRERFDYIFLDLPATRERADAVVVSSQLDGALFVAHWGSTPVETLASELPKFESYQAMFLGVVLNRADPRFI